VPTPFTHLRFAHDVLALTGLPEPIYDALSAEKPAFLLGCIAPDVQTVSGQAREATHFFYVPFHDTVPACRHLLEAHPGFAQPGGLSRAQAAFWSGYVTHLALDELWVRDVFEPIFGARAPWGVFIERLYLHNALRSHLDTSDLKRLPASTATTLHTARAHSLCPFISTDHLLHWRDLIAEQPSPGQAIRTVEVFAGRMGADPRTFAALLASPPEMQRRVFDRLPAGLLEHYYRDGLGLCREVLQRYWEGAL
jgi:hypothetical protein